MDLRQMLYEACAPPREDVTVNGVAFRMVGLSIDEQVEMSEMEEGFDATFWVIERMARDDNDERVFQDADPLLRKMTLESIEKLAEAATRLMAVDRSAKNSEAVHSSAT